MRAFYLRWILYPYFMFGVRHMPEFLDFAYLYMNKLQHAVHGKLLTPDYIEQTRNELAK